MKSIFYAALLVLVVASVYSCKKAKAATGVEVVSVNEMKELMKLDEVQIVDVRTKPEYKSGHIKDAQNVVYDENFEKNISALDKSKPIVVYCQKGGRSAKCVKIMQEAGFQEIYDLEGGITKWIYANESVEN